MPLPEKSIQIDEEGYLISQEIRLLDEDFGASILKNIAYAPNGAFSSHYKSREVLVEAFDDPLVAAQVFKIDDQWNIQLPYDVNKEFDPHSLRLDEWDRFHGFTREGIPFVLSRKAQSEFFRLLDDFDDERICVGSEWIEVPSLLESMKDVNSERFWSNRYENAETQWDLGQPAPALVENLPGMKLAKSRVLVLGCGAGHDAAHFAAAGHIVTAVDLSPVAISEAKKNYGHLKNLEFRNADFFDLERAGLQPGSFDLIFEHTCFCAIDPTRRKELVALWRKLLADDGKLMGVFFVMEKKGSPPFGATEWELRERLRKNFQFLLWGRYQKSIDRRNGKELFVLARKTRSLAFI